MSALSISALFTNTHLGDAERYDKANSGGQVHAFALLMIERGLKSELVEAEVGALGSLRVSNPFVAPQRARHLIESSGCLS